MKKHYRQGDIMLVEVVKPDLKKLTKRKEAVVVGYGEATGHKHEIMKDASFYTSSEKVSLGQFAITGIAEEPIYIEIVTEAELVHPEHDTIVLPPGWYEAIRQREYSPEEISRVAD